MRTIAILILDVLGIVASLGVAVTYVKVQIERKKMIIEHYEEVMKKTGIPKDMYKHDNT